MSDMGRTKLDHILQEGRKQYFICCLLCRNSQNLKAHVKYFKMDEYYLFKNSKQIKYSNTSCRNLNIRHFKMYFRIQNGKNFNTTSYF